MTSMDSEAVLLERRGATAWLTLNRPEAINAINNRMRQDIPRILMDLDEDPQVRVIVVRGAGRRGFCVGADIKEQRSDGGAPREPGPAWLEAFAQAAKPVIASIHGFCLGGGLEIALACDLRIASTDATFGLPEPALGLIPGGGGTQRLPRMVGLGRALQLLLTAERIDAAEAYRIGILTQIAHGQEALEDQTRRLADVIAALPPLAVRFAKQAAVRGVNLELAAGLKLESDLFIQLLSTRDRSEAAAAFKEKREPVFTGT